MNLIALILLGLVAAAAVGCSEATASIPAIQASQSQLDELGRKRIFFGRQSVGRNILDGLGDILAVRSDLPLTVAELNGGVPPGPGIYHARIGTNMEPLSKLDDFAGRMRSGLGDSVEIAFFKLCYVDISSSTDVLGLFEAYRATMDELAKAYPRVTFVHFTVPLMAPDNPVKSLLKTALGRPRRTTDNASRHAFNELLRNQYRGRAPLFDLAAIEASPADAVTDTGGIPSLAPSWTDDGGHLNARGRREVARRLLSFLAGL